MKKLLCLIILLLVSTICHANDAIEEFELESIVVTATRTAKDKKTLPSAVDVITREDIDTLAANTLKDVIGSYSGVAIARSNNRSSLSMRGLDAKYSLLLIDGKRIPAEPDMDYELDRLTLENVERIEIVKGPVSALYGADALGGVVNIITKAPEKKSFTFTTKQGFFTGNGDHNARYSFTFDTGKQDKARFILSGDFLDSTSIFKNDGTTYYPFGKRHNLSARFDYQLSEKEQITLNASYMREKNHEYGTFLSMFGLLQTDLYDNNKRTDYSISYKKQLNKGELYFNAYHSIWDKYNDTKNRLTGQYTNAIYGYYTISGIEARLTQKLGDNHELTFGAEYRPELFKGTGIFTGKGQFSKTYHGVTYQGSEAKTNYYAFYLQDEWLVAPKLFVISALRYDDSDSFTDKVTPKIGVTYKASGNWRFKVNAGKGFRVPSPNQLYLNLLIVRNGALVNFVGNKDLKPENSTSFDFSVEHDFGKNTAKLTFFTSKVKDMIDEVWVAANKIEFQNVNKAGIKGIEADITMPFSNKFKLVGNYTYLDAKNDLTGERLKNRARHKISSRFSYKPAEDWKINFWFDTYLSYWSQPTMNSTFKKSYTVANLNIEKDFDKKHSLALGIENLFNYKNDTLSYPGTFIYMNCKFKL